MISTAGRPNAGRSPSRLNVWGVVLCLSLVSGFLFVPTMSAVAATPSADLSVSGSVSPDPGTGGGPLTFTFTVHNEGPDAAVGMRLVGELPAGSVPTSMSASVGSCAAQSSTVTCDFGTVASGPADVHATVVVVAPNVAVDSSFDVQATVSATTLDPDDTNNELIVSGTVVPNPSDPADLELTSVLNVPNPVTGGNDLGFTATVTNLGPDDATGVSLSDTLATGESFVALGSDPSCTASAGVVTCALGDLASGHVSTVLIVTKTPQVSSDTVIHDAFAVSAPEDSTPGNNALDVVTAVRARRADFVAGYVPASRSITWLNDATSWSHGDPVATISDPTVAFVGIPGGGPGGPVTVSEGPCAAPFACMALQRTSSWHSPRGVFGNLIKVSVPSGYGASNPITGLFVDNWSVVSSGWDPFKVSFQDGSTGTPQTSALVWRLAPDRPAVRVIHRAVVASVGPLRRRRPVHRRAVHERWNVRARPVGRARHRRGIVPYRPGASRLPVSFVAVVVGAADVSDWIAPAAPARCLPPGFAPRRGPRARQTATVVAPRPKTAAAA